ncbi:MAG: oligosaccharide flippase family protein [Saprospiraceae bacterium]|nr:oligosaccharide flippase family protein [Bacteroidia bacterium]NNE13375.1 oligosaccharide flippase family protein [Saprospiraceae bacterium]NNL91076.1 oligosaccharide flippase family protein [Saprospiraceae bacterium]
MSSIKKFAGQAIFYGLGSIISKVIWLLLITVYLTRLLGEDGQIEYGIYTALYSYMTVLIVLFSMKLDTALFRYGNIKERFQESYNTIATIVLLSAILVLFIVFIFGDQIAVLIQFPGEGRYVRWFGFILAFDILSLIAFAKLRLENKAKQFALFKIGNALLLSLLSIFFLAIYPRLSTGILNWLPKFDAVIDYLFLVNLFVSGFFLCILLLYTKGFKFKISTQLVKKIFPYILPLVIVGIANNFIQYFGVPLIQFLESGSVEENIETSGVYEASRKIAGFFALFIGAFNYAAEPFFFNNSTEKDKEKLYGKICNLYVLVGGAFCLGLVLYLDIAKLAVDAAYRESLFIVPILLMAYLILGIYHNISIWYKLSDKTLYGAYISLIGALVMFGITFKYIGVIGYGACAWATLTTYIIMVVLAYVLGQKKYPIKYPVGKITTSLVIITLLLYVAYYNYSNLSGIMMYAVNTVIFLIYLTYVYVMEKEEWHKMLSRRSS